MIVPYAKLFALLAFALPSLADQEGTDEGSHVELGDYAVSLTWNDLTYQKEYDLPLGTFFNFTADTDGDYGSNTDFTLDVPGVGTSIECSFQGSRPNSAVPLYWNITNSACYLSPTGPQGADEFGNEALQIVCQNPAPDCPTGESGN